MRRLTLWIALFSLLAFAGAARAQDAAETQELEGILAPSQILEIKLEFESFKGSLKILQAAEPGDAVKEGQSLVRFDETELKEAVDAAQTAAAKAELDLARTELELKQFLESQAVQLQRNEQSWKDAVETLQQYESIDGPMRLEQSEMNVAGARDRLDSEREELQQLETMYAESDLAVDTQEIVLNRAKRSIKYAEIRLRHAEISDRVLREKDHPRRLRDLRQAVDDAKQRMDQHAEMYPINEKSKRQAAANSRHSCDDAKDALAKLQKDLKTAQTITAGQSGRLVQGSLKDALYKGKAEGLAGFREPLQPGDEVKSGDTLYSIFDDSGLDVLLQVPEARLGEFAKGREVSATFPALPGLTVKGKVAHVAFLPESGKGGKVFWTAVRLEGKNENLRPGMTAMVK